MKRIILLIGVVISLSSEIYAQRTCGSELDFEVIQKTDPLRYERLMQIEQRVADYLTARQMTPMVSGTVITIPVVVHVLHTGQAVGTGLNISMAQIQSQIDVLNEDFQRLNPDAVNTPVAFQEWQLMRNLSSY